MPGLPQEMQYRPSPAFNQAISNLNQGLIQAGEMAGKPLTSQAVLAEVTLPLFNLVSQYIRISQAEHNGYFLGLCNYLYQQQQAAANDNIILAVDPDLAEEVGNVAEAARDTIEKTKSYIRKVQEYLAANKPAKYDEIDEGKDDEAKKLSEANEETWQGLREDALRVLSLLQESYEDLGIMSDNVDAAVYDPDEGEPDEGDDEGDDESDDEGDEGDDEVALPTDEPYESVIGE
jgi:hypothetical protein